MCNSGEKMDHSIHWILANPLHFVVNRIITPKAPNLPPRLYDLPWQKELHRLKFMDLEMGSWPRTTWGAQTNPESLRKLSCPTWCRGSRMRRCCFEDGGKVLRWRNMDASRGWKGESLSCRASRKERANPQPGLYPWASLDFWSTELEHSNSGDVSHKVFGNLSQQQQ